MIAVQVTLTADVAGVAGEHLAFDRSGQRWAVVDGRSMALGTDGTLDRTLVAEEPLHDVRWSADGKRLLASPAIYDLERDAWSPLVRLDAAMVTQLDDPPAAAQLGLAASAYAADGTDLVIAVYYQATRELGARDSYRGPRQRLLAVGPDRALRGVLYAGDDELRAIAISDRLIAAGGATVQVWDRSSLRKVAELEHALAARALAFDASGAYLGVVTADGRVSIWDLAARTRLASFAAHEGDGYAIAFHPSLPVIATGGQDGKLRLWSLTGALIHDEPLDGWVSALAFDATGAHLGAVTRARSPHLRIYSVSGR